MNWLTWDFILGIFIGIATNLLSWWILFHVLVPKVQISDAISKTEIEDESFNKTGYRYRVKIMNSGFRQIIDVQVTAQIKVKGIGHYKATTIQNLFIPLNPDGSLEYRVPIMMARKGKGFNVRFFVNSGIIAEYPSFLPAEIMAKSNEMALSLEDLLSLGTEAYLEVYVFGYDEFSGTRKLFISKPLTLDCVKDGTFEIGGVTINPKDITPTSHDETKQVSEVRED